MYIKTRMLNSTVTFQIKRWNSPQMGFHLAKNELTLQWSAEKNEDQMCSEYTTVGKYLNMC